LPFEDQDAEIAGAIRADPESIGKPIGAYDLLIAGQAIRNKLTLITAPLRICPNQRAGLVRRDGRNLASREAVSTAS
jgi:hypothetical protein